MARRYVPPTPFERQAREMRSRPHLYPAAVRPCDRPMAAPGLISYRYKLPYGYVMIGARDHQDAMREAARSVSRPPLALANLEIWNGVEYVPVPPACNACGSLECRGCVYPLT